MSSVKELDFKSGGSGNVFSITSDGVVTTVTDNGSVTSTIDMVSVNGSIEMLGPINVPNNSIINVSQVDSINNQDLIFKTTTTDISVTVQGNTRIIAADNAINFTRIPKIPDGQLSNNSLLPELTSWNQFTQRAIDYVPVVFTPAPNSITVTYSNQRGAYSRVGSMVLFTTHVQLSSYTTSSTSFPIRVTLPIEMTVPSNLQALTIGNYINTSSASISSLFAYIPTDSTDSFAISVRGAIDDTSQEVLKMSDIGQTFGFNVSGVYYLY